MPCNDTNKNKTNVSYVHSTHIFMGKMSSFTVQHGKLKAGMLGKLNKVLGLTYA